MIWFWIGFFAFIALLLFLDLGVFNKKAHVMTFKEAMSWTIGWVMLGLSFGGLSASTKPTPGTAAKDFPDPPR